ncbi:MAG: hypothetical protein NTY64_06580, partial [Deltaproteobacteria bacterium]|nr:hypothetical protein [Deltaproteobacteria bacterium]
MPLDSGSKKSSRKWSEGEITSAILESDALRSNLEETAVAQVAVDPKYAVLQETVAGFRGILKTVETLLFELNHPFKNWEFILPELRTFALKYFSSYARHPRGPQAIEGIIDIFLDAAIHSGRDDLESKAVDYLLGYLEKIVSELNAGSKGNLLTVLGTCFQ